MDNGTAADAGPSARQNGQGDGDVRLSVPASAEYLRLVRLAAAGLASRLGFTFDEIEDLRIAVDELCFHLLAEGVEPGTGDRSVERPGDDGAPRNPAAAPATMELVYSAGADRITIVGTTQRAGPPPEPSDLSRQILDAVVDEHEVTSDAGGAVTFRLTKRREA